MVPPPWMWALGLHHLHCFPRPPWFPPWDGSSAAGCISRQWGVNPSQEQPASSGGPSRPPPLFSPTTLIISDSITRKIRFFDANTHCMPGATITDVHERLCKLLPTLSSSITRIIIHVGSNDTVRPESEVMKTNFLTLMGLFEGHGKSVFISGPILTVGCGNERFSRLLSLNNWLQYTCGEHGVSFIDNFNVFKVTLFI